MIEECGEDECGWGCDCGATQDVLRSVTGALIRGAGGAVGAGRVLASFAAVCRSWRLAASAPGLWRQALEDDSPSAKYAGVRWGPGWWREEYILAHAGWRFIRHLAPDEEETTEYDTNKTIHSFTEAPTKQLINEETRQLDSEENRQSNGEGSEQELVVNENIQEIEIENESENDHNGDNEENHSSLIVNGHQYTPEPPFGRGVSVSHAALSTNGQLLAVAAEDATIAVWEREDKIKERWSEMWRVTECRWSSAWSVQWSDQSQYLLVTGAVRGATRGEAGVRGAGGELRARAGVAPPGAVAWCGGKAFLALEPRLMAPGLSLTLVWMYSATQRVSDADAEVAAPLFSLYNEANTHYSHIIVMKLSKKEKKRRSPSQTLNMEKTPNVDEFCDVSTNGSSEDEECEGRGVRCKGGLVRPRQYYRVLRDLGRAHEHVTQNLEDEDSEDEENCYVMVCAGGTKGEDRGVCSSLRSWRIRREQKPERQKLGLKERREARERAREQPVEEPEFDEAAVRERCKEPDGELRVQGAVRGLIERAGAVWAVTAGGAACVRVCGEGAPGDLQLLAQLTPPPHTAPPYAHTAPYYIYPAANDRLLVSPCVCGCGGVVAWCLRSLRASAAPPAARAPRPPLAALLLPSADREATRMMVLLGSYIYVWESRVPQIDYQQED